MCKYVSRHKSKIVRWSVASTCGSEPKRMVTWSAPQECCTTNDTKKCIQMCNKKLSSTQLTMHLLGVYNNMTCQQYGVWWATDTKWGPASFANLLDAPAPHRTRDCCGPGCEHRKMMYNIIQHYTTLYNIIQHYTTLYNIIQHYTTLYNIIQHYTTLYNIIQHYIV